MAPTPLSRAQLEAHARRQAGFLQRSARDFDAGVEDEAVRLATTVRVLLHHTISSHALMEQLGQRQIDWVDTGVYRDESDANMQAFIANHYPDQDLVVAARNPGEVGLVIAKMLPKGARFAAPLGERGARLTHFDRWWDYPLIETSNGGTFSRRQLVLAMANRDGGAHVDPNVNANYADFVIEDLGIYYAEGDEDHTLSEPPSGWLRFDGNVAAESMRQVAWEVERTLQSLGYTNS